MDHIRTAECLFRSFKKTVWSISLVLILLGVGTAQETPIGPKWWPSEWGADDQRGAANRITPQKVLSAASLITEGKIYQLGRPYEHGMPLLGKRVYSLTIPGLPSASPSGTNQIVSNSEMVASEIGQVGTQFDGLGHVGARVDGEDRFYNGLKLSEIGDSYGLTKLGVEQVGAIFTRGVLLDVAAYKGVERLAVDYIISVEDVEGTLAKQQVAIQEGDVILFHTGHGQLWMTDNDAYVAGEPGPGVTTLKWLAAKKIVLVGADNWAVEAQPGEDTQRFAEGHQQLLTRNGIYIHENLDLAALAKDKVYEFVYVFVPVPLKGATGSPGSPIAIR
jgi:kynurenine formamidase